MAEELRVEELRSGTRYIVAPAIRGSFGSAEIYICDISESGIQVRHNDFLALNTESRIAFTVPPKHLVAVRGRIIWSHLSREQSSLGRYVSGVTLAEPSETVREALQKLLGGGHARPDTDSIERKRAVLKHKFRERASHAAVKALPTTYAIPDDHVLMVQAARERLQSDPEEARKWYLRARFSLGTEDAPTIADMPLHYREDILAVWEYLERSIDLPTILRVFNQQRK